MTFHLARQVIFRAVRSYNPSPSKSSNSFHIQVGNWKLSKEKSTLSYEIENPQKGNQPAELGGNLLPN